MNNNSPFKKSSISEMCKQIKSAPVVFEKNDGTRCLAFYNNEVPTEATKLYIMFPDSSIPKYIEGNDLLTLSNCIYHNITLEDAITLYNQVNKTHRKETFDFIVSLIQKSPYREVIMESKINSMEQEHPEDYDAHHIVVNKKHACGWVAYKGKSMIAFMKDLLDKTTSELIIDGKLEYNAELDCVYWAAGISSKEFTALKVKMKEVENA